MNTINWEAEQRRFMQVAYEPALRAAKRAFGSWHPSKIEDCQAEFMAKVWDQFRHLVELGRDPEPLLYPMIHWAKRWVQYDRRLSGRLRNLDIQDYRAGMVQHLLDGRGKVEPHDRSSRMNEFLDWTGAARTDDPSELAGALEQTGITLAQWCEL